MTTTIVQPPGVAEQPLQHAIQREPQDHNVLGHGVASHMLDPAQMPLQAHPAQQQQQQYAPGTQQPGLGAQQQPQQQQQSFPVQQQPGLAAQQLPPQQQTSGLAQENGTAGQQLPQQQQSQPSKAESAANPADKIIKVGRNFKAVEGTMLTEGLWVGRKLGGGMQGGVYEVKDKAGNVDMSQVLKVSYSAALLSNIKREWEIGRRLNSLVDPDASLNGYMGTGAGIERDGKFMGMMLERINGDGVNKRIQPRGIVLDIHYIREALFAIFTALDVGQRSYGFHHMDLRMDNVMEQLPPKINPGVNEGATKPGQVPHHPPTPALVDNAAGANSRFKIIDFGLASFDEDFAAGLVEDIPEKGRRQLHGLRHFHLNFANIHLIPEVSPLEKWYRWLWSRKGDVYAVLWDLCRHLDGRIWPMRDRVHVRLLLSLIFHVTGTKILSQFVDMPESELDQKPTRQSRDQASFGPLGVFEKNDGPLHVLRIRYIRIKSWLRPRNPGITAAEALCAPFFQYQAGSNLDEGVTHQQVSGQ